MSRNRAHLFELEPEVLNQQMQYPYLATALAQPDYQPTRCEETLQLRVQMLNYNYWHAKGRIYIIK